MSRSAATTSAGAFCDEPLVREHILGARDLLAQALALGLRVAVLALRRAVRLHDRVEDPLLLAVELRHDAGAAEHLRVLLHRAERPRLRVVARLRPRRDDQPRRPVGQVRPDLLGHVRHHRVQQLQQPLERGGRRRARVGVAVVEPRLDRLEVPVAEVVEGQVVELVGHVREVELAEQLLGRALRLREPREDPALLE